MNDIEIIHLTKKKLRDAVYNNTFWNNNLSALPKNKAIWLINNKRIEEDDYCGVIAQENNNIVGFIYMIPDILINSKNEQKKIYWMIYWWVLEKYESNVLSTYIYNEALSLINNQAIVKSYTESVSSFYEKMPFKVIQSRLRHTIFFSLDASILFARFNFLKYFKGPVKLLDLISGASLRFINLKKVKKRTKKLKYDYINKLDSKTWQFIEPLCKKDLIYKTKDYIDWQICPNQYTKALIESKFPYKTLETGISSNISVYNIKVLHDSMIIGFISFVINYNELNIKYFLAKNDNFYNLCVDALIEHLIKLKRNFIFTDDSKLASTISKRFSTIFTHKVSKNALAHNNIDFDFENSMVLNRDGHFY